MAENYTENFLTESIEIITRINRVSIQAMVDVILQVKKDRGRIFLAGSGGGAGHASHAACDFRKILGIESYSISDNVSELTARVNDESWDEAYSNWLKVSNLDSKDCLFVISVGGGSPEKAISMNLVHAMDFAQSAGSRIIGIAGRDGGYLAKVSNACVVIPSINSQTVTAQVEGFQSLIWHLLVTHPDLNGATPKWESTR